MTSAAIIYYDGHGQINGTRVNSDGYEDHTGKILKNLYNTDNEALFISKQKEMRFLDEEGNLEFYPDSKPPKHFSQPIQEMDYYSIVEKMSRIFSGENYIYIYDNRIREWKTFKGPKEGEIVDFLERNEAGVTSNIDEVIKKEWNRFLSEDYSEDDEKTPKKKTDISWGGFNLKKYLEDHSEDDGDLKEDEKTPKKKTDISWGGFNLKKYLEDHSEDDEKTPKKKTDISWGGFNLKKYLEDHSEDDGDLKEDEKTPTITGTLKKKLKDLLINLKGEDKGNIKLYLSAVYADIKRGDTDQYEDMSLEDMVEDFENYIQEKTD